MHIKDFINITSNLSNKLRLKILIEIANGDKFTSEISKNAALSQPLTQIYLKQLEEAGFIKSKLIPDEKNRVFKKKYTFTAKELLFSKEFIKNLKG